MPLITSTVAAAASLEKDAIGSAPIAEDGNESQIPEQEPSAPVEGGEASGGRGAGGADALVGDERDGELPTAGLAQEAISDAAVAEDGKEAPVPEQEPSALGAAGGEASSGRGAGGAGAFSGDACDGEVPMVDADAVQEPDMSAHDADAIDSARGKSDEDLAVVGTAQDRPVPAVGGASAAASEAGNGGDKGHSIKDVQCVDEAQEGEDEVMVVEAAQHAGPRKLSTRKAFQARAAKELKEGSHEAAIERLRARLQAHDERIEEREGLEAAALSKVEEAGRELQAASDEVASAVQAETEECKAVKPMEQRHREAVARAAALRDELQKRKDAVVLLEMRAAKRKADDQEVALKRRKIQELEEVLAESRRAAEEIKQREQEAKEAMKKLLKEEKQLQLARLGRFARRCKQKMLTCGNEGAEAADVADPATEAGAAPAGTSQEAAPVRVKRELAPAPALLNDDVPVMVVVIDDDSQ